MNNFLDIISPEKVEQRAKRMYEAFPLCKLCETNRATENKSPATGSPQYCLKCLSKEITKN